MVDSLVKIGPHLGIVVDLEFWLGRGGHKKTRYQIMWLPSEVNDNIAAKTSWVNLANADCTVLVHRDLFGEEHLSDE